MKQTEISLYVLDMPATDNSILCNYIAKLYKICWIFQFLKKKIIVLTSFKCSF